MKKFGTQRKVIVYGGSRGIGQYFIQRFADENWTVFNISRNMHEWNSSNVKNLQIDLSQKNSIKRHEEILNEIGRVDAIIFNIGGSFGLHEKFATRSTFEKLKNQNLLYILDAMSIIEKKGILENMILVFMITMAAETSTGNPVYIMLKSALSSYCRYLSKILKHKNIKILRVFPPLILYSNRYLGEKYLKLNNDEERKKFIKKHLDGINPVEVNVLGNKILRKISAYLVSKNKTTEIKDLYV